MIKDVRIPPSATWESVRRDLDAMLREVRTVLNGGFRLREQARCVVDVVIDTDAFPLTVELKPGTRPVGVVLVRAVEQGTADGRVITGGAVTWDAQGAGRIRIHAIDSLAVNTRYDAVVAVVE